MYSYHYPNHNYDQVLLVLSLTKTNSSKTSSLPLADFWHPDRNKSQKDVLFKSIGITNLAPNNTDYCFEYPTPAFKNRLSGVCLQHSKPSMTDLMILIGKECRITIEAKYTEYVKEEGYTPYLGSWYDGAEHRKAIIQCWIDYINNSNCGKLPSAEKLLNEHPDFPYQFLHRTASACFLCEKPILVYQLFFDKDENSIQKKNNFEKLLSNYAKILKLNSNKLSFFIVETEVTNYPKKYKGNANNIFIDIIQNEQYKFGNEITILNGYTLDIV